MLKAIRNPSPVDHLLSDTSRHLGNVQEGPLWAAFCHDERRVVASLLLLASLSAHITDIRQLFADHILKDRQLLRMIQAESYFNNLLLLTSSVCSFEQPGWICSLSVLYCAMYSSQWLNLKSDIQITFVSVLECASLEMQLTVLMTRRVTLVCLVSPRSPTPSWWAVAWMPTALLQVWRQICRWRSPDGRGRLGSLASDATWCRHRRRVHIHGAGNKTGCLLTLTPAFSSPYNRPRGRCCE